MVKESYECTRNMSKPSLSCKQHYNDTNFHISEINKVNVQTLIFLPSPISCLVIKYDESGVLECHPCLWPRQKRWKTGSCCLAEKQSLRLMTWFFLLRICRKLWNAEKRIASIDRNRPESSALAKISDKVPRRPWLKGSWQQNLCCKNPWSRTSLMDVVC